MSNIEEFILTDDGAMPQWVRKLNEDSFTIVEVDPISGDFHIKENKIIVSDCREDEILDDLRPFGYDSLQQVTEEYGDTKNQIIAECIAECRTPFTSDKHYYCSTPQEVKETLKSKFNIEWTLGDGWFTSFKEEK